MHEGHAVELHALLEAAGWLVALALLFAAGVRLPLATRLGAVGSRIYAAACVVAGLGVWVLANVSLVLNDTHIDLTREKVYTPSATAMAVVDELRTPVRITYFYRSEDPTGQRARNQDQATTARRFRPLEFSQQVFVAERPHRDQHQIDTHAQDACAVFVNSLMARAFHNQRRAQFDQFQQFPSQRIIVAGADLAGLDQRAHDLEFRGIGCTVTRQLTRYGTISNQPKRQCRHCRAIMNPHGLRYHAPMNGSIEFPEGAVSRSVIVKAIIPDDYRSAGFIHSVR